MQEEPKHSQRIVGEGAIRCQLMKAKVAEEGSLS